MKRCYYTRSKHVGEISEETKYNNLKCLFDKFYRSKVWHGIQALHTNPNGLVHAVLVRVLLKTFLNLSILLSNYCLILVIFDY